MSWFKRRQIPTGAIYSAPPGPPPGWAPAPETSHAFGLRNEAPEDEYEAAESFCNTYPLDHPKLLSSDLVDRINAEGCKAWAIEWPDTPRFAGHIQAGTKGGPGVINIETQSSCQDVCLLSDLPILAGLYETYGKVGVYFEILIHRMDGIIAIGTACRPYPNFRLPGWNRLSAGLHLDDMRKFFEDPDGGRDYTNAPSQVSPGDTIGCGYEFSSASIFFTYNGLRLPAAFTGVYLPREDHDVYAAVGMEGHNAFDVNFGGELFRWKEGNEWGWRSEGHVGRLSGGTGQEDEGLPSYSEAGLQ